MADFGLAAQIGRGNAMPGAQQQDPQNRMMQMMQLQQLQQNMMLAREQEARAASLAPLREGQLRASTRADEALIPGREAQAGLARVSLDEARAAQRTNQGILDVVDRMAKGTFDPADPAAFRNLPPAVSLGVREQLAKTRKTLDEAEKAGLEKGNVARALTYDMLDRVGGGITGPTQYQAAVKKLFGVSPEAREFISEDYNSDNVARLQDFVRTKKTSIMMVNGVPVMVTEGSPRLQETTIARAGVAPPQGGRDTVSLPAGVQPPTRAQIGQFTPAEYSGVLATPQMGMDPARLAAGTPADVGAMQSGMPGQRLPVAGDSNFAPAATPARGPIPASQFVAERQAAPKPLTAPEERKLRNEIAKDFNSVNATIDQMNGVISAAKDVADLPENTKESIAGWSGLAPSFRSSSREGDRRWRNLEGKITQLGQQAASLSGAIGSMAVQEWKIVRDMIANTDITNMTVEGLNRQIELIESQARGAMSRVRDTYERQYQEEFGRFGDRFKLPPPSEPSAASAGKGSGKGDVDTSNPLLGGKRQ